MATNQLERGQTGTGVRIETFIEDARNLPPADFEERHGSGFLLLTAAGFKSDKGASSTEVILLGLDDDDGSERTAGVSVLVFPLVGSRGAASHLVTVGRTSRNDVVIPDISISRFHGFFKRRSDGVFVIQDNSSTNGSTVNGFSVATKDTGQPSDLKTGDNVRLGQMDLTFLEADALRAFALEYAD